MADDIFESIIWGGISSLKLNLLIQDDITYTTPERDVSSYEIAGFDGDIFVDNGRDKGVDMTIPLILYNEKSIPVIKMSHNIGDWLRRVNSWGHLIRSDDPDYTYECYHHEQVDYAKQLQFLGKTEITFRSKPYKYHNIGLTEISVVKKATLNNIGNKSSQPKIKIHGKGDGNVIVNGKKFLLSSIQNEVTIDSLAKMTTEKDKEVSLKAKFLEYPIFKVGSNTIDFDGGITSLDILPRWRDRI